MTDGMMQTPTSDVVLKPASWLANIDFINHQVLFNNALVTVLSEQNGGKTSFSSLLQNNLDHQIKSASIVIKPPYHQENLIRDIATQLALEHDEHTDLTAIVRQINEQKLHVLLLSDEAQYLPDDLMQEVLFTIKNQEQYHFFHVCLLSDHSIVASLNHLKTSFGDCFIHTLELGPLNEHEAKTYVQQRVMAAELNEEQLQHFYQLTKGNLAKINNELEAFVHQCSAPEKTNVFKIVKSSGIIAGTVFVAGFLGLYLSQSFNSAPPTDGIATPAHSEEIQTIAIKLPELPKQLDSSIASWQDASTRQIVSSSLPAREILDEPEDELPADTKAIVDKVVVIPQLPVKNELAEKPSAPVKQVTAAKLKPVPLKKPIKVAKPVSKKPVYKARGNFYTIQLTASHDKRHIERFRKTNQMLVRHATLRRVTNAKGVWYVLTLGQYQNKAQAQHHASKLPDNLAKLHPWVRPVSNFG